MICKYKLGTLGQNTGQHLAGAVHQCFKRVCGIVAVRPQLLDKLVLGYLSFAVCNQILKQGTHFFTALVFFADDLVAIADGKLTEHGNIYFCRNSTPILYDFPLKVILSNPIFLSK